MKNQLGKVAQLYSVRGAEGVVDCIRGMPQQFPEVCGKVIEE